MQGTGYCPVQVLTHLLLLLCEHKSKSCQIDVYSREGLRQLKRLLENGWRVLPAPITALEWLSNVGNEQTEHPRWKERSYTCWVNLNKIQILFHVNMVLLRNLVYQNGCHRSIVSSQRCHLGRLLAPRELSEIPLQIQRYLNLWPGGRSASGKGGWKYNKGSEDQSLAWKLTSNKKVWDFLPMDSSRVWHMKLGIERLGF